MGRRVQLTKGQIANLRANQARRLSCILTRVAKYAAGELVENGEKVMLSASELKAAQIIRDTVLPAQQATTIEDVTESPQDKAAIEAQYHAALAQLRADMKPDDLRESLLAMDAETRQALIDSLQAETH